ncbi:MAG: flagellar basal-body rod protein FlgG [Zetaproteobacteria bacterium]|nr:MAG: flagellar basal-body rod protein FlgG [Zetaproteobacteria bacterium]
MRSLDIGATGMMAQQLNVDVISNNIANMTTTGYKRQRAAFQDLIYQNLKRPGSTSSDSGTTVPSGLQVGLGVKTGAVYRMHSQGAIKITENELDLAILGRGFFQIELPDGTTAYTRDGTFQINENGEVVTVQGYTVTPSITIPDNAISIDINAEGEILANIQGQTAIQNLGQIQMADFVNPTGLEAIGNNFLLETEASGSPVTGIAGQGQFGGLEQGALEQSNVNVVSEVTSLIAAQRAYEMNSNVISTSDEMLRTVAQLR